jgi:hypothetical protein
MPTKEKRGRPRKTSNLSERTRYRREREAMDATLLKMLDGSAAGAVAVKATSPADRKKVKNE